MKILYIPFSFEDALFDLQKKANVWYERSKRNGEELFIIYHGSGKVDTQLSLKQALQKGQCHIYILSHGMNTSKYTVCNQSIDDDAYQELGIEDVAAHFTEDLVIPNFSDNNVIKLFFCDEYRQENKSRSMAEQFRKHLDKSLQKIEIEYYSEVSLSVPGAARSVLGGAKGALKTLHMTNDLFDLSLTCLAGKAKTFRHGLNEQPFTSVSSFSVSARFFDPPRKPEKINYPEYSHPILQEFAEKLVRIIQCDKILSKNQHYLIGELLFLLPRDIKSYQVSGLKFTGKSIILEFNINKELLNLYLNQFAISPEQSESLQTSQKNKML
ncbi:hypothetical protein [Legionella sp. WA2024007413]